MAEAKTEMVSQIGDVGLKIGQHKNVKVLKDIQMLLVEFVDREGVKQTKLALLVGDEVRFLSDEVLSGPVQKWLADPILIAAGRTPSKV